MLQLLTVQQRNSNPEGNQKQTNKKPQQKPTKQKCQKCFPRDRYIKFLASESKVTSKVL